MGGGGIRAGGKGDLFVALGAPLGGERWSGRTKNGPPIHSFGFAARYGPMGGRLRRGTRRYRLHAHAGRAAAELKGEPA